MQRWEYARIYRQWTASSGSTAVFAPGREAAFYASDAGDDTVQRCLSELGTEGWELCGHERFQSSVLYWLKRPAP